MTQEQPSSAPTAPGFGQEIRRCWEQIPFKGIFFALLLAWLALFHLLGNSTLGYADTSSLLGWLEWMYSHNEDDAHGRLMPFVVLALFWWKRQELMALPKRHWFPALLLFGFALALHIVGYLLQQTQISVIAFFLGIYALTGLVWGPRWLASTFFPFCLFAFCLPIANVSGGLTLRLRLIATQITTALCHSGLGINVIQDGTQLFDPNGAYKYEVTAACSGMRSLTATTALAMIYAFVMLKPFWKRAVMIAAAVPLAVAGNVVRLSTIIVAAEAFGQPAGNFVHDSSWMSMLPYLPAIGGILLLGHWLRDDRRRREAKNESVLLGAGQKL